MKKNIYKLNFIKIKFCLSKTSLTQWKVKLEDISYTYILQDSYPDYVRNSYN